MLPKRMGHLMAHDHGRLIIGELELGQNARVETNLAPGHAKGIDLVALKNGHLPGPTGCIWVPLVCEGLEPLGNLIESHHGRVACRQEGFLLLCFFLHGLELLRRRSLQLCGWHQLAQL